MFPRSLFRLPEAFPKLFRGVWQRATSWRILSTGYFPCYHLIPRFSLGSKKEGGADKGEKGKSVAATTEGKDGEGKGLGKSKSAKRRLAQKLMKKEDQKKERLLKRKAEGDLTVGGEQREVNKGGEQREVHKGR